MAKAIVRTGIPRAGWRMMSEGVNPSKSQAHIQMFEEDLFKTIMADRSVIKQEDDMFVLTADEARELAVIKNTQDARYNIGKLAARISDAPEARKASATMDDHVSSVVGDFFIKRNYDVKYVTVRESVDHKPVDLTRVEVSWA